MSNEITVKIKCSIKEIRQRLENDNFKIIEKFYVHDKYFIPNTLNIQNLISREILSNAILLRNFDEEIPTRKQYKFTFKRKQIDKDGTILKQDKVECETADVEDGEKFLKSIGYTEIINIKENDVVYEKEGLKIAVIDIENGNQLIEVETIDENKELDTIEKIIQKIEKLNIPIDKSNYFVKKAEIELEKCRRVGICQISI